MTDKFFLHGIVLSASPMGENDRRVVMLTQERGCISAFFRGARRGKSELSAASNPFTMGNFEAYQSRNSLTVVGAQIKETFSGLTKDLDKIYLGSYFLEMAEYFGQENMDETERLNLLYVTLKALEGGKQSPGLIRRIYELRTFTINGEYPNIFSCMSCGESKDLRYYDPFKCCIYCQDCIDKGAGKEEALMKISDDLLYALQFTMSVPLNKLYTFNLTPELFKRYEDFVKRFIRDNIIHIFKSEQFLKDI